jgi:arginase
VNGSTRTRPVRLVEVPFNSSGLTDGVARMPDALRKAGLTELLRADGPLSVHRVEVNQPEPRRGTSGLLAEEALVAMVEDVGASTEEAWQGGAMPLVVGGDCPALLGPLISLGRAGPPGMVFVDGHEDAWPPGLSPSGEAADSELGLALGLFPAPAELGGKLPCLDPARLLVLGPRDLAETAAAGAPSIAGLTTLRDGNWLATADLPGELPGLVDRSAGAGSAGWWFHVDLDVLSTEALAAVDYRQPGGIRWGRLEQLTEVVLARPGCRGASVVIYNPDLDSGAAAARICGYLARTAALLRQGDPPAVDQPG